MFHHTSHLSVLHVLWPLPEPIASGVLQIWLLGLKNAGLFSLPCSLMCKPPCGQWWAGVSRECSLPFSLTLTLLGASCLLSCVASFHSVNNASAGSTGSAWDYWKKMCPRNTPAMSAKTLQVEISGAGVPAVCM